jgi:hypothetical protein
MRRLILLWILLTMALFACRFISPAGESMKSPVMPASATPHSTTPIEKSSIVSVTSPFASWGHLANHGFENQRIKTTLFFAGQARDGSKRYSCNAKPNVLKYTVHPADERHLQWSESRDNQDFALSSMKDAGINVVSMSSWGEHDLPCNTGWPISAPMQTAPEAHDELFAAAVRQQLLIMPFIESRKKQWNFYDEFPRDIDGRIAPGTVSQIIDLINRYLKNADHPEWAGRWAQVYDRNGEPRYAVVIIHAASNRLKAEEHALYAEGFNLVAGEVFKATGVKVGFFLDALPPGTNAPGQFKPSPEATGPFLYGTDAVLGIQCFIPEIWSGWRWDWFLIRWKRDFSRRWYDTGIPFIMDVSPGYDNHLVFPLTAFRYGHAAAWRKALTEMVADFGKNGLVYNSWNGYTEAMAAVPLREAEYGDTYYRWLQSLK